MIEQLKSKIDDKKFVTGIIGLGYVGLPLAYSFLKNDMPVIGFDVDTSKIDNLKKGIPYIKHLGKEVMSKIAESKITDFTSDFEKVSKCDAVILCVPTPLSKHREPDMTYVINSTEHIAPYINKDQLIILESTTYPGTMEEVVIPILEKGSTMKCGKDFFVAYSPEREDPGNKKFTTSSIPKVVGGYSAACLELAIKLYGTSIETLIPVRDTKTAEAVKITENIFRAVNIALVNELKIIYSEMGIDVHEVLDAAATKPFGFMKFSPGPGLGGHCIPIDPFYLTWKAKEFELSTRFIELAGEINSKMPNYVIGKLISALNNSGKALSNSNILVVGLAYKPDVDDYRESPTFKIFDLLKASQASFSYHDNFVQEINDTREHKEYKGLKSVSLDAIELRKYDAVIISTNHTYIDYSILLENSKIIIDTRNCFPNIENDKIIRS